MTSAASQNAGAASYWPIYIARSDGQGYKDIPPLHVALSADEDQDVAQLERWLVIVAGHLQIQVGPKDEKRQFKLADFPRGYELRCAVRKDGGRDYYLYGHPAGPKAVFRTPGEFALHALWLVSDSTDNNDCPCDLCPKYVEKVKAQNQKTQLAVAAQGPATATQPAPAAPGPAAPQQKQQQQQQQQQEQQENRQQQEPQHLQHWQLHQQQLQPQHQPALPGMTDWSNVFRVGELVWYKHTAWRLGVILNIKPKPGTAPRPGASDSSYRFTLAPLGHALLGQASVVKDCQSMRPFLTFSVPNATMDELKGKTFDAVSWQALTAAYAQDPDPGKRAMHQQMLGLEASKMGARAVNDAFSTFNLLHQGAALDGSVLLQNYAGVYLGAEMVRVGDPIRVTGPPPPQQQQQPHAADVAGASADANVVMVVREIQVLTPTNPATPGSTIQFKGDLYRAIRFSTAHGTAPPAVTVAAETLGPALVEELATRNAIEKDPTMRWGWAAVAPAHPQQQAQPQDLALVAEQDVHGRFYVTERLMSVVDPDRFQAWVQRGLLEEAPAYLNNRGHSGGGAFAGRKPGRKAMLGDAVAVEFTAPAGMVEN